jgi:uncharacterized membrane protein
MLDIGSMLAAMTSSSAERGRLAVATAAVAGVTALDIYCAQKLSAESAGKAGSKQEDYSHVVQTIIIGRPAEEVYRYWRNFENLPNFMDHVESVQISGDRRSHWKVNGPAGKSVDWDAEITDDEPNRRIAWRTLPGADVDHSGSVSFERAPGDRGTLVRVELDYNPPGGKMGALAAKLFRRSPKQQIYDDLHALKQIMETGHRAISDATVVPGMHAAQPPAQVPEPAFARS